jgi:hypothetical protein
MFMITKTVSSRMKNRGKISASISIFKTQIQNTAIVTCNMKVKKETWCCFKEYTVWGEKREPWPINYNTL